MEKWTVYEKIVPGLVAEVFGEFHLNGSATGDNSVVLQGATDDHDGVVQRALRLLHELLRSSADDKGTRLALWHAGEEVKAFPSDL